MMHGNDIAYDINYCPWCGATLPTSLCDEWYNILKTEYGLEDPVVDDREKVPAEFWSEEWWKKRGYVGARPIRSKDMVEDEVYGVRAIRRSFKLGKLI